MNTFKRINRLMAYAALSTMLSGCATAYYGHTKEEWALLSDSQKQAQKAEYETVLRSRESMRQDARIESYKQRVIDRGVQAGK